MIITNIYISMTKEQDRLIIDGNLDLLKLFLALIYGECTNDLEIDPQSTVKENQDDSEIDSKE